MFCDLEADRALYELYRETDGSFKGLLGLSVLGWEVVSLKLRILSGPLPHYPLNMFHN